MDKRGKTNRLIQEKSPYLLQHAHNPVDWYPWGEEAFAMARTLNKPVFLSIGYSTCHWCHVMEHESFEKDEVAELMNRHFINIKVDREERPDVDRIYMAFVQAATGQGGWPMSVWLTPELKPFAGGTYYPAEDRHGRPGFSTMLQRIADVWTKENKQVLEHGRKVSDSIYGSLRERAGSETESVPGLDCLEQGCRSLMSTFDEKNGGFGAAPKFPRPALLSFLFRAGMRRGLHDETGRKAVEMALKTLKKMADGGMHDHVGGGFHRYSVDEFWHVPHFEKMLYDQAQLAVSYLEAWQITREPFFEKTVRGILGYVMRDMRHKDGGFYSAEDADSLPVNGASKRQEGAFYVWTAEELKSLLSEESYKIFAAAYGVQESGNCLPGSDPHGELSGQNVLIRRISDEELAEQTGMSAGEISACLEEARRILLSARGKRPRPRQDDKILAAWDGLMISAFARAALVWNEKEWLERAQQAAVFVRNQLTVKGASEELLRSWCEEPGKIRGFAVDYAFLIQGLLDLYEADGGVEWLQWAERLQVRQDELFRDEQAGDYFATRADDPHLIIRMKEDYDGAEPSADAVSVSNLLRMTDLTGCANFRRKAEMTLTAFGGRMRSHGMAVPQMLAGLERYYSKPVQVVLTGEPELARKFGTVLRQKFRPSLSIIYADGGDGRDWLISRLPFLKELAVETTVTARLCRDHACQLPVFNAEDLLKQAD